MAGRRETVKDAKKYFIVNRDGDVAGPLTYDEIKTELLSIDEDGGDLGYYSIIDCDKSQVLDAVINKTISLTKRTI